MKTEPKDPKQYNNDKQKVSRARKQEYGLKRIECWLLPQYIEQAKALESASKEESGYTDRRVNPVIMEKLITASANLKKENK